jgi:hypothetical protein
MIADDGRLKQARASPLEAVWFGIVEGAGFPRRVQGGRLVTWQRGAGTSDLSLLPELAPLWTPDRRPGLAADRSLARRIEEMYSGVRPSSRLIPVE